MKELRSEVLAIFGDLTVKAAERTRPALVATLARDGEAWEALGRARETLAAARWKPGAVRLLDEATRRALALCLLDRAFLSDVMKATRNDGAA